MYDLDYQIPIIERNQLQGMHHSKIPVNKADPRFHDPLVKLDSAGIAFESWHARTDGKNPPYGFPVRGSRQEGWLRKSLVERLALANQRLKDYGAELFIMDAYRSMECQFGLWEVHYSRGRRELQTYDDRDCTEYALRFARDPRNFDPEDSRTFPTHASGASIDVTMKSLETGEVMNMGSRYEEYVPISYNDFPERMLLNGEIDESNEILQNRRLMQWALTSEGLRNDPLLYWHYDWGNQPYIKWKKVLGEDISEGAWYGYIGPPEWESESPGVYEEEVYA